MKHLRSFAVDYWKAIAGGSVWAVALASCWLVPDTFIYLYGTLWIGAVVAVTAFFVLGYIRFSKPSKDPVTRRRSWSGVWAWILSQATIILLVFANRLFFRIANDMPEPTTERLQEFAVGAAIYLTVFFVQLWITWIWTWRQVHSRREIKAYRAAQRERVLE